MRRRIPLRYSIPVALGLLSLTLITIVLTHDWSVARSEVERRSLRAATALGEIAAQTVQHQMEQGEDPEEVLTALRATPQLKLAVICGAGESPEPCVASDPMLDLVLARARAGRRTQVSVSADGMRVLGAFPINFGPRFPVLVTEADMSERKSEIHGDLVERGLLMGLAAAILCVGTWLYLDAITRRAAQLVRAARDLAAGNLQAVAQLQGSDELADVADSLNKLASEQRRRETAVLESERRLRFALETSRLGAWELDLVDHTVHHTALHDSIFGYASPLPEWSYQKLLEHVLPEDRAGVEQSFQEAIALQGDWSFECRIRRADGEVRWIAQAGGHVRGANGDKPVRLAGIVQDITDRKHSQAEKESLEWQLRQSQKMEAMGTLAGGIAHDFNNILQAILGNAELARAEVGVQQPAYQTLTEILAAGARARELIRRILAFSRHDPPQSTRVQLEPIVEDAARLLRAALPAGVELKLTLPEKLPAVQADPSQVHQVLMNLATNAWQALEGHGGRLELSLDVVQVDRHLSRLSADLHAGLYARISLSDTGKGMDQATRQRAFDPFFTTKATGQGTGLGLSIVQSIMRNHGGAVTVESTPGHGSTFQVYFPVPSQEQATPVPAPEVLTEVVGRASNRHVLYLDDEEMLVSLARRSLEGAGYRFSGFTVAAEALAAFRADPGRFDLLVTDFNMPGMSGIEVTREVLRIRADVPVVLTSGYMPKEEEEEARAAGVREVLHKPIQLQELPAAVQRLLALTTAQARS